MTLRQFFKDKNATILNPGQRPPVEEGSRAIRSAPRTGPGAMLAFNAEMQQAEQREQALREKLERFDGALPVKKLDPKSIRLSAWANRSEQSFGSRDFAQLKQEISLAGENVQPIKVRPIVRQGEVQFELVYGQRRLRACADLGLQVNALIQEMSDRDLFLAMDQENRARADLSPYELGKHYKRALDSKLWPSQNVLAKEAGITQAYVSQVITLAGLADEVVSAFPSALDIQVGWGLRLAKRWEEHRSGVQRAVSELKNSEKTYTAREVYERLMGLKKPAEQLVKADGKIIARCGEKGGNIVVTIPKGTLTAAQVAELPAWIAKFVQSSAAPL